VPGQQRRDPGRVDEHVLVMLVPAAPGAQTRGQQVPGQRPAAAAELEDQPVADAGQQLQDAGGAPVGVQAVALVVNEGQVALVVVHRLSPRR